MNPSFSDSESARRNLGKPCLLLRAVPVEKMFIRSKVNVRSRKTELRHALRCTSDRRRNYSHAAEAKLRVIVIEAGRTLLLERDAIADFANRSEISIVVR